MRQMHERQFFKQNKQYTVWLIWFVTRKKNRNQQHTKKNVEYWLIHV